MRLSSGKSRNRLLSTPARRFTRHTLVAAGALAFATIEAPAARAQSVSISVHSGAPDSAWIVSRLPLSASSTTLQNRSKSVVILLMDTTLVFQFTDRGL